MNEVIKSKGFKIAALAVAFFLVAFASFAGGVSVGLRKAKFSYAWGQNYERNFIGSRMMNGRRDSFGGMMRNFEGRDFRNAHGLAGTIISIADDKLIIKDRDGKENTAAVTDKTLIKKTRFDNLKLSDLKTDDQVVVMGKPDDNGTVNAILIRVFDK